MAEIKFGLRFSAPLTLLIGGLLALTETTLANFPELIPIAPLRFFVQGAIPLFVAFLFQSEGLEPVPTTPPVPAPTA